MATRKKPSAALQYLDPSFFEHSPKHRAALEEARASQEIGRLVAGLRTGSGMSVRELARAAGLTPKALEKLVSGTNPRLGLAQLRQVASALGRRVEVKIVGRSKASQRETASKGPSATGARSARRA
jgi:lambda repressor-like predicted transcriptional regulator